MNALVQNALVAVIVLGAAGFLVWRRVRRKARPSAACGDCPACATTEQQKSDWALVGTTTPRAKRHARARRG